MNLQKMDLNLFLVFEAITQTGSLTQAAHRLHLSQPAVSHALARLREHLHDPLFVRQGRRMEPTPLARRLSVPVARALELLKGGLSDAPRQFEPEASRQVFTLGMRDILESLTLPRLMQQIRQLAPGVSVHSVQVERHEMAEALRQGRVDAVVDIALPVTPEVHHERLLLDQLVVVARQNHPALRHSAAGASIALDQFLSASHVLVSARRQGLGLEDYELSRQGLRRHIGLRCRHYFAACRVVSQTDMLLSMPEQYARVANRHFDNVLLDFPLTPPQLDAHLYWHSAQQDDPTNRWFRERILNAVRQELDALPAQDP